MSIISTVPGAVQTLLGYMQTVADNNPDLQAAVYTGHPVTSAWAPNFLMVGSWSRGIIVAPTTYTWETLPGTARRRGETYAIQGCIRAWSGSPDGTAPLDRLTDAFRLHNDLHEQILLDIGGSNSDPVNPVLSPSGAWGQLIVTMEESGQLDGEGWGVVLGFELQVINALLMG